MIRWLPLLLAGPALAAVNLVRNPSFEDVEPSGQLAAWSWAPGGAKATVTVAAGGHSGERCALLANETPLQPHVFGALRQNLRVAAGQTYTLSCWVKSARPGRAWIGGGPDWKLRVALPTAPDWQRVSATFTVPEGVREWQLLIVTEEVTADLRVDDVQVEPGEQATAFNLPRALRPGELTVDVQPSSGATNLLPNASFEAVEDGVPTGWRWDPRGTDAKLTVSNVAHAGRSSVRITNGTAFGAHVYGHLQTAEPVPVRPSTRYTLSCFCRTEASPGIAWVGGATDWRVRLRIPDTRGVWLRVTTTFETRADETSIPLLILTESPTTGFWVDDVQLEAGLTATAFAAPDTVLPAQISLLALPEEAPAPWKPDRYPPTQWAFVDRELRYEGGLSLPEPLPGGRLRVTLRAGDRVLAEAASTGGAPLPRSGLVVVRYGLPAEALGEVSLEATLADRDGRALARETCRYQLVHHAAVTGLLGKLEQRLPALDERAKTDDYQRVTATVARNFLAFCRADLTNHATARAYDTARVLEGLLDRAQQAAPQPPAPRYVTSPLQIVGPAFEGLVKLPDGTQARRPVYFTGFGHFGQVRRDIEQFPAYGHNLIQIEFGPNSVLPAEGQVSTAAIDEFLKVCDRAAASGVQVNLLLSPHYFPAWAMQKWPHLADFSGGFLRYSVYAPEARAVVEQSLRTVIPRIKNHPALHSVCLSNEPLSLDLSRCRYAGELWRQWLAAQFGTVAAVNARWGTTWASLADVPVPPARFEASAMVADFVRFNQEAFAGWHRWMADLIHELAPDLPVHAKIMMMAHFNRGLHGVWSIAPELFSELSQINGNDCCKWKGSADWACDWVGENMGYDYQRSAADLPVFNSENHLIVDRDVNEVDPAFIRNVLWQGAIHGQGATTIWVWERTYDAVSDAAGSILHRPECVEASGHTALDLNRAAPEVAAIAAAPLPVAVLWSQTSTVWRGDEHAADTRRVYAAANFLDVPVGFVNERDAAVYAAGRPNRIFSQAKLILVPRASHVPPAVVAALARFVAAGGRVIRFGDCCTHDDTGRPLAATAVGEAWPLPTDQAAMQATWQKLRAVAPAGRLPVGVFGVETRAAEVGGGVVANLCNYLREPVDVKLPAGCRDVLSGETVGERLTLAPLASRLVRR